jgi:asparagine synthase (glutamine-hydrolysing)
MEAWAQQGAGLLGVADDDFAAAFAGRDTFRVFLSHVDVARQLAGRHPVHQSLYVWGKTFLPNYVLSNLGDRMEMAHSVEGRLPFCDPDVVDLALSLQQHAVADGKAHPKAVLQRAYAGLLPESVVRRPKVAFQDGLGLKDAITAVLPNPARFYKAEYQRLVRNSRA